MYLVLIMIMLIVFVPIPIYFAINQECLKIYGFKIPISKAKKDGEEVLKKTKKHIKVDFKFIKKLIRIKKIRLSVGYGLDMIDESMDLYALLLVVCPMIYGYLVTKKIDTYIQIQNIPIQKSACEGMFNVCLARLLIRK